MVINFGSAAPAPPPVGGTPNPANNATSPSGGAPTTAGFSFGGGATPNISNIPPQNTAAASTATGAPAPAGGNTFQFGGSTGTAALAPAQTTQTPAAPPTNTTTAPPPATGASATNPTTGAPGTGFGFNTAPAAPAATPAAGTTFGFGASTGAPSTTPASGAPLPPTGTTFNLSGSASSAPGLTTNAGLTGNSAMKVPTFNDVFPNLQIWSELKRWILALSGPSEEARSAGQELLHFLSCQTSSDSVGMALAKPEIVRLTRPDGTMRQNLQSNPVVFINGTEAPLSRPMLEHVLNIANDLHISESHAIALYWKASRDDNAGSLIASEGGSLIDKALSYVEDNELKPPKGFNETTKVARELYFLERSAILKSLRHVLQSRIGGNRVILEVSDGIIQNNLLPNLVSLIREWTARISELEKHLSGQRDGQANMSLPLNLQLPKKAKQPVFEKVHLVFAQQERQMAVECIFYLAYHTQLTGDEIVSIVDLIKDLTNGVNGSSGLALFNPFSDVPNPHEPTASNTNGWTTAFASPFSPAVSPPTEKDVLSWQKELISKTWDTGAPHLLNCVAPLVLAAICAMDARQELMDRDLHGPNSFGVGNKLLPPGELTTDRLNALHSRLNKDGHQNWKRGDIFGLLAASYALLLRSAPQPLLMSPRANTPLPSIDIRGASRACLELPTELKSFTFARHTLLPALQRLNNPSSDVPENCDNSEFFLSVVSEFVSHYLDVLVEVGDMPISRQKWEKEEQEELNMRQLQEEQQRQFLALVGTSGESETIPSSIDLMKRPDCMDDVIALATAVCSIGPEYARNFWSAEGDEGELIPSRVLAELDRLQGRDESLMPCFLSFLAALSCAHKGAAAVHKILSRSQDVADGFSGSSIVNWISIMNTIRWYVQQFIDLDYDSVSTSKTSTASTPAGTDTTYYYGSEGFARSASSHTTRETSSSTSSSPSKPKELGERNAIILSSNLAVIMSVVSRSAAARSAILSMRLPINGGMVDSGDETLLVMFALAKAPLSPELRGAVFTTISCLLQTTDAAPDEEKKIRDMASTGWDCVESCQFLPISMLDQYPQENVSDSGQLERGMGFPPTSTSLAAGGTSTSVLPADPRYGLVYEMEHVESRMGWYPSTEGFLKLLKALVEAGGCPPKLGERWRLRTGCSPYVEFVVDFVLPRALGTSKLTSAPLLPFRVTGDQSRLVSHALSVVDAVLRRYRVPSTSLRTSLGASVSNLFGIEAISKTLESAFEDEAAFVSDYKNQSVSRFTYPQVEQSTTVYFGPASTLASTNSSAAATGSVPAIPSPKSPGFAILADILSSGGGNMFHVLASILVAEDGKNGGPMLSGLESDRAALAYALFRETPPSFSSAKTGAKQQPVPSKSMEALLKPAFPSLDFALIDATTFDDAVLWRERSIILALRILCATAFRDEPFHSAVVSAKEPLKIVPLLRFQRRRMGPSSLHVVDVQLSRLTSLLYSSEMATRVRSSFVDYIGFATANTKHDIEIATTAIGLFNYSYQAKPAHQSVRTLCGFGVESEVIIARAMAKRLRASAKRPDSVPDSQVIGRILNWILTELRDGRSSWGSLVEGLLGLPGNASRGQKRHGTGAPNDCFDAILELLEDEEFVIGRETSYTASLCFEIIFRLYDLQKEGDPAALRSVQYTAEKLRKIDFWRKNVRMLLSDGRSHGVSPVEAAISDPRRRDDNVIHSLSWLLKGASCELQLLAGLFGDGKGLTAVSSPHPQKCEHLLSLFLGSQGNLVETIVQLLPLGRNFADPTVGLPSNEVMQTAYEEFPGDRQVFGGYIRVNGGKLIGNMKNGETADQEAILAWVDNWNSSRAWDCASSHLSNSLAILLGSALRSFEAIQHYALRNDFSGLSLSDPNRTAALTADSLVDILTHILRRLLGEGIAGGQTGMDGILVQRATWNLSSAVLLLSHHLASHGDFDQTQFSSPNGADIASVCSLLARAVVFSREGSESSDEPSIMHERTTILGSALALMLRSLSFLEPDFAGQQGDDIVIASATLSELACLRIDGDVPDVPLMARSILGSLIETCSEDEPPAREQAFVYRILSKPVVCELVRLVSIMDADICNLLLVVAMQRFGSDILIASEILKAMQFAASKYFEEEKMVLKGPSFTHQARTLASPRFLEGHLRLLSTLLTSQGSSQRDISKPVLDTLSLYSGLISRIINDFPNEENVLQDYLTCLLQAIPVSQNFAFQSRRSDFAWLVSDGGFLRNQVYMLSSHLWENPLPRELLGSLPSALASSTESAATKVANVNVIEQPMRSWSDNLDQLLNQVTDENEATFPPPTGQASYLRWTMNSSEKRWSQRMFEYNIVAIDVLILGLSLLKRTCCLDVIDRVSIVRGLCKCIDAAWSVDARLEVVSAGAAVDNAMDTDDARYGELEKQYLTLFGDKLKRAVETLLVTCVMYLREMKRANRMHTTQIEEFSRMVRSALDQAGLQSKVCTDFSKYVLGELQKELV